MQRALNQALSALILTVGSGLAMPASSAVFTEHSSEPFGTFNDVEFVRHTGRFEGTTSLGNYSVPFEIVAPADPTRGNGVVLVEPPHFFFGPLGRDSVLGRSLVFNRGLSYASVGWAGHGFSVLDPSATPIILAGEEVVDPGALNPDSPHDFELIVQFVNALKSDPEALSILGGDRLFYSFGLSQTSAAQLQILLGPDGQGLFDFNLITVRFWPEVFENNPFTRLRGEFIPPDGIGRSIIVNTEAELILTDAEQFRNATSEADYRVYEVSGASHLPQPPPLNPLDYNPIIRAAFVAGDRWVRQEIEPPDDNLIAETSGTDPVYGFETGIARDFNGNARGGVRRPEVEVGQATYIASLVDLEVLPGLPGLVGTFIDLACEPMPDGSVRFRNHGDYVSRFSHQANRLVDQGFLLPADAEAIKESAAESDIGKPGSCN